MVESSRAGVQVPPLTLPVHSLTRYLRSRFAVVDGELRWDVPRTLLGIVPVGVDHITVPIVDVREVRVHTAVRPVRLLIGGTLIVLPLVVAPWWVAAPVAIVGGWVGLASIRLHLEAETIGASHHAGVCFGHRFDAELYADAVNDLVRR